MLRVGARGGLVARTGFYLLLAYLTVRVALVGGQRQANANGALRIVGTSVLDSVLLGFAAAGFALFGVVRLRAAWGDHGESRLRRATVALQGLGSFAVAQVPLSFALGKKSTGSEQQQQHETQQLLGFTGGQVIVVAIGLAILGWVGWQIRGAVRRDQEDGLQLGTLPPWARTVARVVAGTGLVARAVVVAPIGVFLVIAGITYRAGAGHGLDGELLLATRHAWGSAALILVAVGLVDFAAYAALEARFRDIERAA